MCLQALQRFARKRLPMKQCKEKLATSLSVNLASNMACGTFMSGILRRVLMTFLSLSGSTDLDLSIVADGSSA
jgi:hypothetical protein